MGIDKYQTHLGGDLANLAWEDLAPHELIKAVGPSSVKAANALELAERQIKAATELGDDESMREFQMAAWVIKCVVGSVIS